MPPFIWETDEGKKAADAKKAADDAVANAPTVDPTVKPGASVGTPEVAVTAKGNQNQNQSGNKNRDKGASY